MRGEFYRSLGLEPSGPKSNRTSLAVLDYHPKARRLIVVDIESRIQGFEEVSADESLLESVQAATSSAEKMTGIGVHGPLSLPPALAGVGEKPGTKSINQEQIEWLETAWQKCLPRPKPFVSYLQRPCEIWLRYQTQEKFAIPEALGANSAPITARMQFLGPKLPEPLHEVFPKATFSRICHSLNMSKAIQRDYLDVEKGLRTRELFFESLSAKLPQLFIYDKDLETMILNISAFNAFLNGFMQHLVYKNQFEQAPKNFPHKASWIHIPKRTIKWDEVF